MNLREKALFFSYPVSLYCEVSTNSELDARDFLQKNKCFRIYSCNLFQNYYKSNLSEFCQTNV